MFRAIITSKMLSFAYFTKYLFLGVPLHVIEGGLQKFKIINSIIRSYFINMMNNFRIKKISSDFLFHYQSMLSNITSRISFWMRWVADKNISISFKFATFPVRMKVFFREMEQIAFSTVSSFISTIQLSLTRKYHFQITMITSSDNHIITII